MYNIHSITVYPKNRYPFYTESYYLIWGKSSWTFGSIPGEYKYRQLTKTIANYFKAFS